ncbi:MAG: hypothetical protein MZV70_37435 [Desulfobacterales bacterium]|nr:hypothetical protein [Desulfobacterales bacterium]
MPPLLAPSRAGTCTPPEEIGHRRLPGRAARPTGATAPRRCKGLWAHQKGGFYHDGRFATLGRGRRATTTPPSASTGRRPRGATWSSI